MQALKKLYDRHPLSTMLVGIFVVTQVMVGPAPIPSGSMEPTMQAGDVLLANRLAYGIHLPWFSTAEVVRWSNPERGDIVVFNAPPHVSRMETLFIKRVVAVAGDVVEVKDHRLVLNGQALPYADKGNGMLAETIDGKTHIVGTGASPLANFGPYQVPAGHVFVMGDNRAHSSDSRAWGPLDLRRVRGQARYRIMGLNPANMKWPGVL
jgi:signal peptidase I